MRLHPEKAAEPTTLLKCLTFKALSVHSNQWTKGEVLNALLHLGQSFHDHVFNNVCRNKIIALLDNHNVRFSELHNPHTIAAILGNKPRYENYIFQRLHEEEGLVQMETHEQTNWLQYLAQKEQQDFYETFTVILPRGDGDLRLSRR